jgi:Fur family ferric uptake transcriptional regulator
VLQKKWKMTNQRKVILEELRNSKGHLSADELYVMVKKKLPNISISTIYRNLEELSKQGLIRKISPQSTQKIFDANIQPHFHIRCVKCGRIDDIPASMVQKIMSAVSESMPVVKKVTGYEVIGYHLEFFGVCSDCQQKEEIKNKGA